MSENLICVRGLTKTFGKKTVLSNLNLEIRKGEIYAIVGNNGAGKTTLIRMLCNQLKKNEGEIVFSKKNLKVGTLIESPGLFGDMTAFNNLKAKALCLGYKYTNEQLNDLLELVSLGDTGKKLVSKFSMGMKQRLGIALALIGDPDVLMLDEPTNSLDPQGINEVRKLIEKINREKGVTIIISSHILEELFKVATRFCIIHRGQVIKEIATEDLKEEIGDMHIDDYYLKTLEDFDKSL